MNIEPRILLFEGRGWVSKLIKLQTRSKFSHAAILMRDGNIIEAWQGDGVRIKRLKSYVGVTAFDVKGATPEQWDIAIAYAKDQVGAKYDYMSVLRFVTRRKETIASQDNWFCSELDVAAFKAAGIDLLSRISPSNVSPGMLALSPLLIES